ncbi:M48 family metallopeptidase [Uruburuella testudinis]|uniref:M48 family metallopeptidase n=1 Tax=Uruburuella testudinis TaxID=1282863 RepID=A0ABY4DVZ3_9NEIS|nr:SprT family zinc-dependent metalloprotease [Uruburuella testudinis]UOO83194.1 M48 family metallopeptidase [Uruburuella testudinis]
MMLLAHTLSDGRAITLELKRSAKKNIIMRPLDAGRISVNVPPYLGERPLRHWLQTHEDLVLKTLACRPKSDSAAQMPAQIWYRGEMHDLHIHTQAHIRREQAGFLLPSAPWPQQKQHLRRYLTERAAEVLLPRLQAHAEKVQLFPAAAALSNAKTFWGVCRSRSGIRLNWRLIGAPDFVVDYVCIHELCHIPHPNHSSKFWAAVNRHTPHTAAAKQWLKQHGSELFVLD